MTAPVTTAPSGTLPTTAQAAGCPACPHPMAAHDLIGARFCRATTAGTVERGCVCRIG